MSEELLPLFPLKVVLFPNSILPLHIFEDRYKQLINECLSSEGKEFGISLVMENEVAKVGCTAIVTSVVQRFNDGRMNIHVEGKRRYVIRSFVTSSEAQYSFGRVEFLSSIDEMIDGALAMETVAMHNRLVGMAFKGRGLELEYEPRNALLSFKIAQKAGMELGQRQALLEMDSENARMQFLHHYFSEVIPKLERHGEVERVVRSDGYLTN